MTQEKIKIKDVTPQQFNPKTHKGAADRFNPSNRIYVRAVTGIYQQLRRRMGWVLMVLFMGLPWIPYGDRQAILLDIGQQQFNFFGTTLWPQDLTLLATVFMIAAFALFFVTTFLGRVWCGYFCPQTVWTFIYIWFEEKLEGAANKRRKQDSLKLTQSLIVRKTLKHIAWLAVALITGLTFVGYFVPIKTLFVDFFTFNTSFSATFWVLFFTGCTYANAGWMRSIVCIHMCPYARFQSAMFDKDTYIVGYDTQRGEARGPRPRKKDPKALGLGDCIDCNLCVQVCPTGIDIRDGLQYECINCGACVDACDETMTRMGYEKRLISYTTEHKLEGKHTKVMRPKLIGYGAVMVAMVGLFFVLLSAVSPMGLDVIRDRSQLFRENNEGLVENTYTLKILNKTQQDRTYQLKVEGIEGIEWYGPQQVAVAAGEVYTLPISLGVDPYELTTPIVDIRFTLSDSSDDSEPVVTESRFIGELR
ncbi:cytochrome c oxidase accessory protein CcoG [Photobacterium jeanii]|uniref:Cytochrome c oxidase accessory protein CcoG n=1 Tax=Photobacterium jeanii TaxID=858640 RepID=A0A178K7J0_9GAMM|nr:cytochrome c oxidase accessory protein CcoG [Photobacterium jeanii]OAN12633.1 cytochrome c oxidase accessory protein CcoG [Photobacterium jeanii]PST86586.1 cytochrome c oxidase accessory protein CcoG [Photobacterium jeanii]